MYKLQQAVKRWRAILVILPLGCIGLLAGISLQKEAERKATLARARDWNRRVIDSVTALLQPGDVVLRSGLGADSRIFAQMNSRDKSYTHCGIVVMEQGKPVVYHCIGGEENPDMRMRRDPPTQFFAAENNSAIAVVRYDGMETAKLSAVVHAIYSTRPRFDLKFDLATDDALYCSEFVYKALIRASGDTGYVPLTHRLGRTYVAVDNLYGNDHDRFICRVQYK
jgi:hypothetical protein